VLPAVVFTAEYTCSATRHHGNRVALEGALKLVPAQEAGADLALLGGEDNDTLGGPQANKNRPIRDQVGGGFNETFRECRVQRSGSLNAAQSDLQRRPDGVDRCSRRALSNPITYDAPALNTETHTYNYDDSEAKSGELKEDLTSGNASHKNTRTLAPEPSVV